MNMIKYNDLLDSKLYSKEFHKVGIYKIFLNNPKKVYVGSTTVSFKRRFQRHIGELRKNDHHSIKLQYAYNKYGEDSLKIEILETLNNFTKEKLMEREQFWIDFYDSYKNGYNSTKRADNSLGFKMYEYIVEKRRVKFLQYDLEGNFIREWKSFTDIAKEIGSFADYNKVISSSNYSAYGFLWRKKTENYPLKIDKYLNLTKHEIYQYSLAGEFIKKWESLLDASNNLNIPVGNICHHLEGLSKICYGFYFSRTLKEYNKYKRTHPFQKKIKITNLKTNEVLIFDGKREAALKMGINRSALRGALDNNNGIMIRKQLKIEEL